MKTKKIVLYERYDGVRFVIERSLSKYNHHFVIQSSHWKNEIESMIDRDDVDLLITEINRLNSTGIEISRYARRKNPNMKIIWITVLGCFMLKDLMKELGHIRCIEKPLEINDFRQDVFEMLEI
jgi:DNA-binding NtrC family response regulator